MDPIALAMLALIVGALIGGGIATVIVLALRARDRAIAETNSDVPDGIREVLAGMEDAVAVVDSSTTVRASSVPAAGFGMRDGEVLPSDELRSLIRSARAAGASASSTLRLKRGTQPAEPRLVSARATVITPRLILLAVRDITESARVEQMRRDFVANTSHELKTPVGAVSLLAEAIESAADDPDQVRIFTARLSAEAARLVGLTSRIMNLSRLQAADELTDVREVAVDEIVTAALEAHTLQADSAGVGLERGGTRGLFVRGDAQVLIEAVGNLVTNAIVYSPRGGTVGIGVKDVDGAAEIAVTDRGIGISEADQERIFERFYRTDQARSRRTGGSGLGLSIVKHAVQRHGGEVRLWSRPGRGSTFTVSLPQVGAPADLPTKKKKKKKKALPMTAKRTAPVAVVRAPSVDQTAGPALSHPAAVPPILNGDTP